MSGSRLVNVADRVADALNDAFAGRFTATRAYIPRAPLKTIAEANSPLVLIVPRAIAGVPDTRASTSDQLAIDIGVCARAADDSETDSLMALVQELSDWFRFREIHGFDGKWAGTENDPAYDAATLNENKAFVSVLTVRFTERTGA